MDTSIQKDVSVILDTIKTRTRPHSVFLFGSHAYGQPHRDSDIDLCIVAESAERKIDILRAIRTDIFAKIKHPLDLVIYFPEEFKIRSEVLNSFEYMISHKGVKLYG